MTKLSVNLNKIALLRNSRGRDYPSVLHFAKKVIDLGVQGITVHPRQDERHITRQDVIELSAYTKEFPGVEFNIEGYPSARFLSLIEQVKPDQCTLVPDAPDQLTSDHGWDIAKNRSLLIEALGKLKTWGVRSSVFLDPQVKDVELAREISVDRIELYTESFAQAFGKDNAYEVFGHYKSAAARAVELGIGLNAGHDLDLRNLSRFLIIPKILEVSIGHALIVESLEQGMDPVVKQYLAITGN